MSRQKTALWRNHRRAQLANVSDHLRLAPVFFLEVHTPLDKSLRFLEIKQLRVGNAVQSRPCFRRSRQLPQQNLRRGKLANFEQVAFSQETQEVFALEDFLAAQALAGVFF